MVEALEPRVRILESRVQLKFSTQVVSLSINLPIKYPKGLRSTRPKGFRGCEICHGSHGKMYWPEDIPPLCMALDEKMKSCLKESVVCCIRCGMHLCEPHMKHHRHSTKIIPDHNHYTGEFRGWLCANCNSRIGLIESGHELGKNDEYTSYLRKHGSVIFSTFFEGFAGWIDPKYRAFGGRETERK